MIHDLTMTEIHVLNLISEGYTNKAIANFMFVSEKTVEHHANNMYSKLEIPNDRHKRVMAMRYYLTYKGIIKED